MIVTCEQCATQFQLDDAKVPVGGVRVRCSRCKHAFFIEPLGAELPQSPLDRAAQAALDSHAPPAPEASEDLVDAGDDTGSDFGDGEDFSAGDDLAAGNDLEDGNDLADGSNFGDANDLSDERSFDASASGGSLAGQQPSNPSGSDESIADESDWEFNEDRFRGESLGAEAPAEAQDAARAAIDDLLDPSRSARAPGARAESAISREPAALAADGLEEDLGSPENWDLLAGDAPSGSGQASAGVASESQPSAASVPRETQRSVGSNAAPREIEEWIDPSEPSALLAWIARSGHALGWGVTVTLFALVAFATLGPGIGSDAQSGLGTQRLAQLEAQAIAGRWVENAAAGPLFVVSGRLVNPTAAPRELGALAGVRLLDASGARLVGETAAIGPVLEPRELREAEPAALQARQLEAGRRLAATSLEPGQSLAFEAVLAAVPAAAARFVLEPIPQGRGGQLAAAIGSEPAH